MVKPRTYFATVGVYILQQQTKNLRADDLILFVNEQWDLSPWCK